MINDNMIKMGPVDHSTSDYVNFSKTNIGHSEIDCILECLFFESLNCIMAFYHNDQCYIGQKTLQSVTSNATAARIFAVKGNSTYFH